MVRYLRNVVEVKNSVEIVKYQYFIRESSKKVVYDFYLMFDFLATLTRPES